MKQDLMPEQPVNPFQTWPKVELHRHLSGSVRFETWWNIVKQDRARLRTVDPMKLYHLLTVDGQLGLKDFLKRFDMIDLCFVDAATIEKVTCEAIADAVKENIAYLELRFSPTRMARRAGISTSEALEAVIAGRQRAAGFPIEVSLITGLSRELGVRECAAEAEIIGSFADRGINGIDLLGNEADYPAAWFAPVFQSITCRNRIGITIHAGEAAGAENVRSAILQLGATRIGHGVRSREDPAVLGLLKERGVVLEMCPTSNVQTAVVPNLSSHPLAHFLHEGVKVTINTDNPQVSQVDLAHEYKIATSTLGLSETEIFQTILYAIEAAFTTDRIKERIKNILKGFKKELYDNEKLNNRRHGLQ
ncbi:MAG: adenosine deaminase [Spirochaetota bacterium]